MGIRWKTAIKIEIKIFMDLFWAQYFLKCFLKIQSFLFFPRISILLKFLQKN